MRFSFKWLREFVDIETSAPDLANRLTAAGLEVDSVEPVAAPLNGVVVGVVLDVAPHPNADRLRVCQVDVGRGGPLPIVCGAPDVVVGMRAPTALVGATLPGGQRIAHSTLRGVASAGMLCSARELGLADAATGLLALPAEWAAGQAVATALDLDDVAIEVDLTPNRGDCLSLLGIAREVGALTGARLRGNEEARVTARIDDTFPVRVFAEADCPRYAGRVLRDIDPLAQSPLWLRERLRRSGLRSISAVVDVTNYVLLELGQPMHAFDLDRLAGGIEVRRARSGERAALLDGSEVELGEDTLVVADANGPQALAGIMGCRHAAVGETTRHVFLESAFFRPDAIAGRPRRYGLQTDSSYRFERGVDFNLQRRAMERATELLLDIVGGRPGPVVEVVAPAHIPKRAAIRLRTERVWRMLGLRLDPERIATILTRLGMSLQDSTGGWLVTPPSARFDLALEVDLIEEVARIHGYEYLPSTPPVARAAVARDTEASVPTERIAHVLVDRGYQEAITFSFVDPKLQARLDPEEEPIPLTNPISSEMGVMRASLWSGLIQALRHNQNRQQMRVRLFETGLRFRRREGVLIQEPVVSGVAAGDAYGEQWGLTRRPLDYFDVKGDVEALLALGGDLAAVEFRSARHPSLHPGQTARVLRGGADAGILGAIHPALLAELDLQGPVYLFELRLEDLRRGTIPRFQPLSKFPAIRRDIAVVLDADIPLQTVRASIGQLTTDVLQDLELFDVYQGEGIDPGKKSLAIGLTLQAASRTLTDTEVDDLVGRVLVALERDLRAVLRG